jgi:hypothetical protein
MRKFFILICLLSFVLFTTLCFAQWDDSYNYDSESDNLWDSSNRQNTQTYSQIDYIRRGGVDRDTDNDGTWDYNKGGIDRDADNDGTWDYGQGGVDRDLDNDGVWDYGRGGVDRDMDNDGTWDY